jgi:DNA-binding CsgD family transcriptional regulator
LTREGPDWRMHPLLRRFLLMKFQQRAPHELHAMALSSFEFALGEHDWDFAFALVREFDLVERLETLIRAGLGDLLAVGRLATLRRWVERANSRATSSAAIRIAEAEIAFRDGIHIRAEALAAEAADELPDGDHLRAQGLFRAGQAAYFNEHYEAALDYFARAVTASSDASLEREALWAAFIAALDFEHPDTIAFLDDFSRVREPNVNDAVRMANAELIIAMRRGGITEAVSAQAGATHLVGRATDPMIRTAFWNTYGWALALNSRYEEAKRAAARELEDAATYRLSFVEPHAQLLAALAAVGMRELTVAEPLLEKVVDFAHQREDLFLLVNASAVLARLYIAREDFLSASATTSTYATSSSSILYGEYLGVRALVLAALGETDTARATIASVRAATSQAEAQALVELAELILALKADQASPELAFETITRIKSLGQFDAFVTAYRASPELIDSAIRSGHDRFVADLLSRAGDIHLAKRYGLVPAGMPGGTSLLSRREEQVLDLVAEGRTNDEVARALFISPVTVKAHLRHIYEKLGVRNRVEAVAWLSKERTLELQ